MEPPDPVDPARLPGGGADDEIEDRRLDEALDELTRWVSEAQVDEAIELRRRSAWLRRQSDEEATVAGVLLDLGEQGASVALHLVNRRHHRGVIVTVGLDVVELRSPSGERVAIALDAVEVVRAVGDDRPLSGDRPAPAGVTWAGVLAELTGDRSRVLVVSRSGDATTGTLTSSGQDVLTLALDGGGLAYVSLAGVAEVSALESG